MHRTKKNLRGNNHNIRMKKINTTTNYNLWDVRNMSYSTILPPFWASIRTIFAGEGGNNVHKIVKKHTTKEMRIWMSRKSNWCHLTFESRDYKFVNVKK